MSASTAPATGALVAGDPRRPRARSVRARRRRSRYDPVEVEPRRLEAIGDAAGGGGRGGVLVEPGRRGQPIVGAHHRQRGARCPADPSSRRRARAGSSRSWSGSSDGRFVDVEAEPTTPRWPLASPAKASSWPTVSAAEICLAVDGWVAERGGRPGARPPAADRLRLPGERAVRPGRRRDGTLRAYVRQRVHDDPYRHVGRQDLTAHVDVTAVERGGHAAGLVHLGTTTQAEFLVGLGTRGPAAGDPGRPGHDDGGISPLRSALMRLLDPAAMGRFRVMGFGRAWPGGRPLAGSPTGFRRGADRTRTAPDYGQRTYCRSAALDRHARTRSGTTRQGVARDPARALGAGRSLALSGGLAGRRPTELPLLELLGGRRARTRACPVLPQVPSGRWAPERSSLEGSSIDRHLVRPGVRLRRRLVRVPDDRRRMARSPIETAVTSTRACPTNRASTPTATRTVASACRSTSTPCCSSRSTSRSSSSTSGRSRSATCSWAASSACSSSSRSCCSAWPTRGGRER